MNTWTLLINFTLKSTLILALAWAMAFAMRRRSAASRHIVWTAAFAGILALPLLSLSLPSWSNRWANGVLPADSGITFHATTTTGDTAGVAAQGAPRQGAAEPRSRAPIDKRSPLVWVWAAGAAF